MDAPQDIEYSSRYHDDHYEYRHVQIPKQLIHQIPRNRLLHEDEWRAIGIVQSRGWENFLMHSPEPHILLFRRPKDANNRTGKTLEHWNPPNADTIPNPKSLKIIDKIKQHF
eukprot:267841_1